MHKLYRWSTGGGFHGYYPTCRFAAYVWKDGYGSATRGATPTDTITSIIISKYECPNHSTTGYNWNVYGPFLCYHSHQS